MIARTADIRSGPAASLSGDLPPAVRALLEQGTAPGSDPPRLIQTHISWVVLVGPYAYKLKKPLALDFLDYSSPEKRLEACHREVVLNRRLCPWVYLGVVPISDTWVEPDGSRTVLDYAVRMRRLPQNRMLDAVLERGEATVTMMAALAERLASFHAHAATGPGVDEHGSPAAVWANAAESFRQTRPFIGRTLDAPSWAFIHWSSLRFLEENLALFERRVAEGRIRDGHGDLHAANVCMTEPIAIFDCIEFNDRFRCGDVAAEVAFLAMDLEYMGRADLATSFVDRYVEISGDRELRDVLDFYVCYRAYVRGKVESLKLDEPGFSAEEYGAALTGHGATSTSPRAMRSDSRARWTRLSPVSPDALLRRRHLWVRPRTSRLPTLGSRPGGEGRWPRCLALGPRATGDRVDLAASIAVATTGLRWAAIDDRAARATVTIDREPIPLTVTIAANGRLLSAHMDRWGNLTASGHYAPIPFGADILEETEFGGYTVPSRLSVRW